MCPCKHTFFTTNISVEAQVVHFIIWASRLRITEKPFIHMSFWPLWIFVISYFPSFNSLAFTLHLNIIFFHACIFKSIYMLFNLDSSQSDPTLRLKGHRVTLQASPYTLPLVFPKVEIRLKGHLHCLGLRGRSTFNYAQCVHWIAPKFFDTSTYHHQTTSCLQLLVRRSPE